MIIRSVSVQKFLTLFILIGLVAGFTACSNGNDGPASYTIIFNSSGGEGTMPNQTVVENASTPLNANVFTKEGYNFAGWALSEGGTVVHANGASVVLTSNLNLFAVWETIIEGTVIIIFNPNGGSGVMPNQVVDENTTETLNENTFTRELHTFEGWSLTAGGGVDYEDEDSITVQTSNINLFAVWKHVGMLTVSFNLDGGTLNGAAEINSQQVAFGGFATRPFPDPTRDGFVFVRWYHTNPNTTFSFFSTPITDDITLTARWERLYTITFDPNGGVGGNIPPIRVVLGGRVPVNFFITTEQGIPAMEDHRLIGYSDAPEGGTMYYTATGFVYDQINFWFDYVGDEFWNRPNDTILYAQWQRI